MRIEHLSLQFLDGHRVVEGYTTPGWYVCATDADEENHSWAVRPVKITPEVAETIAGAIALQLGHNTALNGVKHQNVKAKAQAREAVLRAQKLAEEAQKRVDELAEWAPIELGDDAS